MAAESKQESESEVFQSGVDYDEDNVFSKIIAGTIPSYKIFENDHVIALLDAFPSAGTHSLSLFFLVIYGLYVGCVCALRGPFLADIKGQEGDHHGLH